MALAGLSLSQKVPFRLERKIATLEKTFFKSLSLKALSSDRERERGKRVTQRERDRENKERETQTHGHRAR